MNDHSTDVRDDPRLPFDPRTASLQRLLAVLHSSQPQARRGAIDLIACACTVEIVQRIEQLFQPQL